MSQIFSSGSSSGMGVVIKKIITDSGTAIPDGGIVNIVGGNNINTVESSNNALINLNPSITINSAVAGDLYIHDNTIESNTVNAEITLSPATYVQTLSTSLNATVPGAIVTGTARKLTAAGPAAAGMIPIAQGAGLPPIGTYLTAGSGISISNVGSDITISSDGSASGSPIIQWEKIIYSGSGSQTFTLEPNKGYFCDSNSFLLGTRQPITVEEKYPVVVQFPHASELTVGDTFVVVNIGFSGTIIAIQSGQKFLIDLIFGGSFSYAVYPSVLYSYNGVIGSAIWFQYVGISGPYEQFLCMGTQIAWKPLTSFPYQTLQYKD